MIYIIIYYLILLRQLFLIIDFILRMHFLCFHSFNPLCSYRTLASFNLSAYNTSISIFSTLIYLQGHKRWLHITICIHNIYSWILYVCQTVINYGYLYQYYFPLLCNLKIGFPPRHLPNVFMHIYTKGISYTPIHISFFNHVTHVIW